MAHWAKSSMFYHIYPLGLCGAPAENRGESTAGNRLQVLYDWLEPIQALGCNAIYLGPIFQSVKHGYDTSDYYQVDSRLGTNEEFAAFASEVHRRGMRLVLDGVFNHVGRGFWAFQDLQRNGQASAYRDWFVDVDFSKRSPAGDGFEYATWEGHSSLVKLNLHNPDVRQHLFDAVRMWTREFKIDGLRLDAADCVEPFFWKELHQVTRSIHPEFWLMGEIIHGDYRQWANEEMFDSVTNYTAYKGLWSSLNDANYHEIAYTLEQQFERGQGLLSHLHLYNFVDNHDVSRIASQIKKPELLYPLYILLYTMPGIPSVYYGSEFGVTGKKEDGDGALRQAYDITRLLQGNLSLQEAIQRFSAIRSESVALRFGDYRKVDVQMQQFAFLRTFQHEKMLVVLNASDQPAQMNLKLPEITAGQGTDVLNGQEVFPVQNGMLTCVVPAMWGRIIQFS